MLRIWILESTLRRCWSSYPPGYDVVKHPVQIDIFVGAYCTTGLLARASRGENDHGRRRSGGYRSRSDVLFASSHSRRAGHDGLGRTAREVSVRATAQGQGSTAIGGRVVKSIEASGGQGTAPCTAGWVLHVWMAVVSIRLCWITI